MIKAPFNFVPLPDRVVFPEWAPLISHDVPFSDGISGTIRLSLTAESPIFVRNGHSRSEKDSKEGGFDSFCRIGDRYFLPASTVKGAVRNVLEILSFGKMRLDRNARFAQREWDNTDLYPMKQEQQNVRCGWLRVKDDGSAEITDCGRPLRIGHDRIDEYFDWGKVFEKEFSERSLLNLNKERKIGEELIDPKTAFYKYRLIEEHARLEQLTDLTFSQDADRITRHNAVRMKVDMAGDVKGTIVLTGQPDKWKGTPVVKGQPPQHKIARPQELDPRAGKFYEFIFRTPVKDAPHLTLTAEEFNQYKFIYADSPDWKYANEKLLPTTGIPVFFRIGSNGTIKDWGLAFLYKLPYAKTPYETLPSDHRKEGHDMADCIFGFVGKEESLKGRVQFSPFMGAKDIVEADTCSLVLNGPKASYYPIYINQEESGKDGVIGSTYKTYNDGMIRGWKRYLRRGSTWDRKSDSDSVNTSIRPIKAGAVFEGTLRFHNLRPTELGALLSAITFHGNESSCRHQIGMAKPYGYGKIKMEVREIGLHSVGGGDDTQLKTEAKDYMEAFEMYMSQRLGLEWTENPTVKELITLSKIDVPKDEDFRYMVLDMSGRNDFSESKGGRYQKGTKYYLQKYSQIIGQSVAPKSLLSMSLDQMHDEANRAKVAGKADEKNEIANRLAEELRLDAERKLKEQAEAKAAKAAVGLTILEELNPITGKYKIDEFKKLRNKVSEYLDKVLKVDKLPADQIAHLERCMLRLSKAPSREEKKKKMWTDRSSSIWTYTETITSKDYADELFHKVNG